MPRPFPLFVNLMLTAAAVGWNQSTIADVYAIDDGSSELAIGIDPNEDQIWFNRFDVQAGGDVITSISVAYGRPGGPSALNGLPVSILLYEDLNGGSPLDAVLKASLNTTVANGNTNTLNRYPISPTAVRGQILVGVLYRNTTTVGQFIGALDTTAPHFLNTSFAGFGINLDPANLGSIPSENFRPIEEFAPPGNFLIRANVPPPSPSNDQCSAATLVSTGSTNFTTISATTDGPDEPGGCGFAGSTQIDRDVWFKWLSQCNGVATISLCGASFDPRLAVYIGCPSEPGNALACNEDFCGTAPQVSFASSTATLYRIRIGGGPNASGTGTVVISCVVPPPCPADINHDAAVNIDDLVSVITGWGPCSGCVADVNHDNIVNIDDLVLVITNWGACS